MSTEQAFSQLTIDRLRPLALLLANDSPKKKGDLVAVLTRAMTDPAHVRTLYDQLEPLAQLAVREATHDPKGHYARTRFVARHGREPEDHDAGLDTEHKRYGRSASKPRPWRVFFADGDHLPTDTRQILLGFVPRPDPFRIPTRAEPPTEFLLRTRGWASKELTEPVPVRVRETARTAEADLLAVLRLIDTGKVRVTDKKRVPTEAGRKLVAGVLTGGDFYTADDEEEFDDDPAHDLAIEAFAWPMLVQAAGLAEKRGDALKLTPAGRTALSKPPAATLKKVWSAWTKTRLLDEFSRVEVVKGQGRAGLTAATTRRGAVLDALRECPTGEWFAVEDLWRLMRGSGREFTMAGERSIWEMYISEHQYGSLGYDDEHVWEQLQGRFILAFLFEYAATVGLLDVAYVPPQDGRDDFRDRWGADDLSCFSRYDGLLYMRINPFGAWCLGLAADYQPVAPQATNDLRVLANLDVVATRPPSAADRLTLERFADETSPASWKLSAAKILAVVEQGGRVQELEEFLASRSTDDLPPTVETFLGDLRRKAGLLKDGGPARVVECADEHVAAELANDRQLKGKCLLAGGRLLVVREVDLATVRKAVRKFGYVWPIPGD
ncbi:helicase-associated domain-containing protein [Fimbriiglobus ruber]|uniref:Helicase XPB/Ssl2 N-terminal domain-containing protein n=1 Tax=Fimbriiglobus ruber TaxID=1908690 RepID=A0A225D3Q1_9BACT|nr:helicase-associated domain-containing protein [Fimbriiglobus ruber]OWK36221.1 hypothetical protein FRUB_08784 [Fimbriiglobus ruber]